MVYQTLEIIIGVARIGKGLRISKGELEELAKIYHVDHIHETL